MSVVGGEDLLELVGFLRQHERCARDVVLDRVLVLPEPRRELQLGSGLVDGDDLVHAVAAAFPLALCNGEVLMSRRTQAFDPGAVGACARCTAVLQVRA